jgi:hypothetical protein
LFVQAVGNSFFNIVLQAQNSQNATLPLENLHRSKSLYEEPQCLAALLLECRQEEKH